MDLGSARKKPVIFQRPSKSSEVDGPSSTAAHLRSSFSPWFGPSSTATAQVFSSLEAPSRQAQVFGPRS
ncbi:hypothetical protein EUGRSUZ_E00149 [Eucalyptus grandis]|uniref:Uncharacterized protein n=2 Tax=Eucalyptus grandis TaxID=71139 RepID=A0ACC3KR77_EUCGR|nr:hypothetical protein EUGRSUZ_E00149 [Eucalyptus grandis]